MSTGIFYPTFDYIANISNSLLGVLTFFAPHTFTPGEVLSLRVTPEFGMIELNNQEVKVLSATTNTVTIDVDTTNFIPFVFAGINVRIPCIAVPAASGVIPNAYPAQTNLLDTFDHIPPS